MSDSVIMERGSNYASKRKRMEEEEAEIKKMMEAHTSPEEDDEKDEDETPVEVQEVEEDQEEDSQQAEEVEDKTDWKKRYGDLRRLMSKKESEWKKQEAQSFNPPASTEDVEAWAKQHPEVSNIIETIAFNRAKEMYDQSQKDIEDIRQERKDLVKERAEAAIAEKHPDFFELREDDKFHDWVEEQPIWIQNSLFENEDDPKAVIRVIDLYKMDNKPKRGRPAKAAAESVKPKSPVTPSAEVQGKTFRESEVSNMSLNDFEKYEEEILEAQRKGNFIYDLSGGAR